MSFKISKINSAPSYDSLPVAKVVTYPLETRDYKPFAQNILCAGSDHLYLRMWAFEVNPLPASRLECVLYLFKDAPDTAFSVTASPEPDGGGSQVGYCLMKNGQALPVPPEIKDRLQAVTVHPHNGEDLQGIYWGYAFDIPLTLLKEWGGRLLVEPGCHFPGNFYKICSDEPFVHSGCFYPADFAGNPYMPASMGDFEVVTY